MQIITLLALFLVVQVHANSSVRRCSALFKQPRPGYSLDGKPLRMPPAIEINFEGRNSGHIRLQELIRDGVVYSHPVITERTLSILKQSLSGTEFGPKDSLVMLDVMGDLGGRLFQKLIEGLVHSKTLDIIGLEAQTIDYRIEASNKGTSRVVLIIRDNIKDYRELPSSDLVISNRSDALSWLSSEISQIFLTLFEPTVFDAMNSPAIVEKTYNLLGKRPNFPKGHPREWLTKSEFKRAFSVALSLLLQNMNTNKLLYMRPSFWDEQPKVDRAGVEMFHFANQKGNGSIEQFAADFSKNALELRERLYNHIHRTTGSVIGGSRSDYKPSEFFISRGDRGANRQESTEISGITAQQQFGLDFFAQRGGEFQSISEATEFSGQKVQKIALKLEQNGFSELVQLSHFDASKLESEAPFLNIQEIQILATELAQHRIFMSYPSSIYFRLAPDVRTIVKPPKNRQYTWDPVLNIYVPKAP